MQKDKSTFFSIFENYKLRENMAHKGLSKSKYVAFCSCEKLLWLRVYKSELAVVDDASMARMETGNEVGDLAMQLFGDFVEVTAKNDDGSLNLKKCSRILGNAWMKVATISVRRHSVTTAVIVP